MNDQTATAAAQRFQHEGEHWTMPVTIRTGHRCVCMPDLGLQIAWDT